MDPTSNAASPRSFIGTAPLRLFLRRSRCRSRPLPLAVGALLAAIVVEGCSCDKKDDPTIDIEKTPLQQLVPRRVPDTDLVIELPRGWLIDMPDPGPLPDPPLPGATTIRLDSRELLIARPGTAWKGTLITPKLQVLQDAWLPVGTTGVDYLVAQRTDNQKAIGANIRHVEAEPSRREGRPTYHVRDEWTVRAGDASRDVSQEALLLLDTATTPDGQPGMHGYTVVITMEKLEFLTLQPVVREILASIRFDPRPGSPAPTGR